MRASTTIRPALYAALIEPLSKSSEDAAVKLSAAEALRSTLDDFNFDIEQFAPFASHAISALYKLLVCSLFVKIIDLRIRIDAIIIDINCLSIE